MNRRFRSLMIMLAAFPAGVACDQPGASSTDALAGADAVFIVDTEFLESPIVSAGQVFRPGLSGQLDPDDPASGNVAAFHITITAAADKPLMITHANPTTGLAASLAEIDDPLSHGELTIASLAIALDDTSRAALSSGQGLFWIDTQFDPDDALLRRIGVILPVASITPTSRLTMFTSTASDGAPLRAATIELADEFLYVAVIGDSVQWGNGLQAKQKFSHIVSQTIEQRLGVYVVRQVRAQSGARILPAEDDLVCTAGCNGEVPTGAVSISTQAELIENPEAMDLILMDGCINDVIVSNITSGAIPLEELQLRTEEFCGVEMAALLRKTRLLAPEALVVVTAYFPTIGPTSDLFGLEQYALTQGGDVGADSQEYREIATERSALFDQVSRAALADAVATVNAELGDEPPILFAPAPFGPEHAAFAPDAWLWSLTAENPIAQAIGLGLQLFPEDPMLDLRLALCFEDGVLPPLIPCLYSSVGHPNAQGAQAYATEIIAKLEESGFLPPSP